MGRRIPKRQPRKRKRGRQKQQANHNLPPAAGAGKIAADAIHEAQKAAEGDAPANETPDGKRPCWNWRKATVITNLAFTAGLVLFAGIQSWAGCRQWKAMRDQYSIMEADQRPWLTVEPVEVEKLRPGERFNFRLEIKNWGKSPGRIIGNVGKLFFLTRGVDKELTFVRGVPTITVDLGSLLDYFRQHTRGKRSESVVPPSGVASVAGRSPDLMDAKMIQDIGKEDVIVAVIYYIQYEATGGGEPRESWCHYVYNPHTDKWVSGFKYNSMN